MFRLAERTTGNWKQTEPKVVIMAEKNPFLLQIEKQIDAWQEELDKYLQDTQELREESQAMLEQNLKNMEKAIENGSSMMRQIKEANESAWADMEDAARKAFEQLQSGWDNAVSRYQK